MGESSSERNVINLRGRRAQAPSLAALVHDLQRAAYVDAPWLMRQLDVDSTAGFLDDLAQAYGRVGVELPSDAQHLLGQFNDTAAGPPPRSPLTLQDPWAYEGLRRLWGRVDALNRSRGRTLGKPPLLATLPTGQINARAIRADQGEIAILFDDEIRSFAYMMSKVVATVLITPASATEDHADLDFERAADPVSLAPKAAQWFAAVLDNYIGQGWVRTLPPWVVTRPVLELALVLCGGFETFVMAHEFAHHAQGHLVGAVPDAIADMGELTALERAQAQEMEADAFGLQIACDAALDERGDALTGFWGAYLAFKSFELIERTLYTVAHGTDWARVHAEVAAWRSEQDAHPAPGIRAAALFFWFAKGDYEGPAATFANAIDLMFDKLFMNAFPALVRLGHAGVHPRFHEALAVYRDAPRPTYAEL